VGRGAKRGARFKLRDLFAGERCSQPMLDFLSTTGLGRQEAEELGAGTRSNRSSFRHPPSWPLQKGSGMWGRLSFVLSFAFSQNFLSAPYISLGQAWAEGKGELVTSRLRAD